MLLLEVARGMLPAWELLVWVLHRVTRAWLLAPVMILAPGLPVRPLGVRIPVSWLVWVQGLLLQLREALVAGTALGRTGIAGAGTVGTALRGIGKVCIAAGTCPGVAADVGTAVPVPGGMGVAAGLGVAAGAITLAVTTPRDGMVLISGT